MPSRHYSALKYRRVSADIFYMPRGSAPIILEDLTGKSSSIGFAATLYA